MIFANLSPLANHLWQSTLCVALAWLLTLVLKKNRAAVRYWLWLAASLKFLIPFSLLVSTGNQFGWRTDQTIRPPQVSLVMNKISRPFVPPAPAVRPAEVPAATPDFSAILFGLWLCGFAIVVVGWVRWWQHIRAAERSARLLHLSLPIPVMSSRTRLEPGIFGVCKPVLLLPEGITDRLTPAQLEAVLAHELCHVRRHDNLTAAIHMLVEAIFWFYPLLWWIRTRLIDERERACDEEVLRVANDPHVYAEGILNVCKFYLESPLICASGVTGADLKKRIEKIMAHTISRELDWRRKLLLAVASALAVFFPIAIGIFYAPPIRAQSQSVVAGRQAFEVASIRPNRSGARNSGFKRFRGGQLNATNITLKMLIAFAYDISQDQILGGPGWLDSERYDVVAKPEVSADVAANTSVDESMPLIRRRTQTLLADRFKLTLRKETRQLPIFELVLANGGPKHLQEPKGSTPDLFTNGHHVTCQKVSMEFFAKTFLTGQLGRPVLDKTGIKGDFDFSLEWTPELTPSDNNPARATGEGADARSGPDFMGPSLFTALQQELGLKLEATKGPVEILVVDQAEKASEN